MDGVTVDIREFLEARLAEDEAVAVAACGGPKRPEARVSFGGHWHADPWFDGTKERADLNAGVGGWLTGQGSMESAVAEHAARHDPARVLRDVEAKRRQIAALEARTHFLDNTEWYGCQAITADDEPTGDGCTCGRDAEVLEQLRLMASVWSDHPDYDPAWSPENVTPPV